MNWALMGLFASSVDWIEQRNGTTKVKSQIHTFRLSQDALEQPAIIILCT